MHAVIALHAAADRREAPIDTITLDHDERRVRRKLLRGAKGTEILLDLPQVTTLAHGQRLELDDGSDVAIVAAPELLYEIRARDTAHLIRLAWHIGNRHTPAQLDEHRILIKRDHVLKTMLEGLGATVSNVTEPFFAEHGAYHSHSHTDGAHALLARP